MFRHVVMFKWADGIDADHVAAAAAALNTLPGKVGVLRSYVHGPDAGISDGNFDYVVVADLDSAEDYAIYRDHPEHLALIAEFVAGKVSERSAIQYEIG